MSAQAPKTISKPMSPKEAELIEVLEVQEALKRIGPKIRARHQPPFGLVVVRQRDLFLLVLRYKRVLDYAWRKCPDG